MPTLKELRKDYREYLEFERALRPQTIKAYMGDIVRLQQFIGAKDVTEITLQDLRAHMRDMAQAGLSTETIRRRIHSLNTFYKWLMLEGIVNEQTSAKLQLPKRRRKQPVWLSDAEIKRFVNTPSPLSIAWKLMAWFGLRRSEVLTLDWRDVRLTEGIIIIRKSKGDDRVLPIPNAFKPDIAEEWIERGMPTDGLVTGITKSTLARAFTKHLKKCGLEDRNITPHTIRHSFASSLIRAGVSLTVVKDLLGHKDVNTTMIYVHHSDDLLSDAMNKHPLGK